MAEAIDISIVTPSFNEAANIPRLYRALEAALAGRRWELIVVDNNSPDQTWRVARELRPQRDNLRVGRYDGIAPPANQEAMHAAIRGSRLEWFEGGHVFMLQDPRANQVIREFLL